MKRIFSAIITIAVTISIFANSAIISNAAASNADGLQIKGEYLIQDTDGLHSEYVVVASNNSGTDLSVFAKFYALSADGTPIKVVSDYVTAAKNSQTFIVYGQFRNSDLADVKSFSYDISTSATTECRYDAVNLDVAADNDGDLILTGTNYSTDDIGLLNVRTVFFKDGAPVGFGHVNLGDGAYTFRSGSSNTQSLYMLSTEYDNYLITYSAATDI